MNNNYHTQMDKPNILNEIAANNNLLQTQIQNFQGTPINKNQSMQQLTPQQIMYAQLMQQNQGMESQNIQTKPDQQNNKQNQQTNKQTSQSDEIELSDTKPEPNTKVEKVNDNQSKQINKQIQEIFQNTGQNGPPKTNTDIKKYPIPYFPPPIRYMPPAQKQQSKLTEYIIIPIFLMVIFFLLTYPSTSKFFNKYLPNQNSTKGVLVRAFILAIFYIIIKMVANMMQK